MPLPLLLAQAPGDPGQLLPNEIQWLIVWGDPQWTDGRFFGGLITWVKVLGLICLVAWGVAQLVEVLRGPNRAPGRESGMNLRLVPIAGFLVLALLATFVIVLEQTGRIRLRQVKGLAMHDLFGVGLGLLLVLLVEWVVWSATVQSRSRSQTLLVVLLHLVIVAAFGVVFAIVAHNRRVNNLTGPLSFGDLQQWAELGLRYGTTYAGLVVLGFYTYRLGQEAVRVRWRRLFAIAWHTVVESYRRMLAPWVVLALFVLVLAFTSWYLGRSRTAELASMYVTALAVLTSLLLSLTILVLSPISLPNDIRFQTIYTVVSKPVRRLELVWGRLIGFMALVTALLVVMGGAGLVYIERIVEKRIEATQEAAKAADKAGRTQEARRLREDAYQLATRRSARVPLFGALSFTDSHNRRTRFGIDVGMEQARRSHIEGNTPSKATWVYGMVPDPDHPRLILDRRIKVEELLRPGSIEAVEDQLFRLRYEQSSIQREVQSGNLKGNAVRNANDRIRSFDGRIREAEAEVKKLRDRELTLARESQQLQQQGKLAEARRKREERTALHSDPIPVELTFNVFRTTKGEEVGEAVQASMVVTNPLRGDVVPARDLFPIHEYYTIRRSFPAEVLVGSMGNLVIDVQCLSPNQFLGMAEDDLFILARRGDFRTNYIRGLAGIWLQTLVVAAVGLFAGTFLSWPVAILLTLAFYLGGQIAIGLIDQISQGQTPGGGPFESMIRLLGHENLQQSLEPTPGVLVAMTFDRFLSPVLSCLVYVVPNLTALDVSNTVASGFAVDAGSLMSHILLGLGYALPFTAAAYIILKRREVAA